jgi:hypothetical protein
LTVGAITSSSLTTLTVRWTTLSDGLLKFVKSPARDVGLMTAVRPATAIHRLNERFIFEILLKIDCAKGIRKLFLGSAAYNSLANYWLSYPNLSEVSD